MNKENEDLDEKIFLNNNHDLNKVVEEHPNYTKVYVNVVDSARFNSSGESIDVRTFSLSKNYGDNLFLVSNKNYKDLKEYFKKKKVEIIQKKKEIEPIKIKNETPAVKKPKQQQNLQFFFKSK